MRTILCKMDRAFRGLLPVCFLLGIQIQLPVTMFPASHVGELNQHFPYAEQREFNISEDIEQWSRTKFVNKNVWLNRPTHNFSVDQRNDGLKNIKSNQFQISKGSDDLRDLNDLIGSGPIKQADNDNHLPSKQEFISEKIKQTEETLTSIRSIVKKNENDLTVNKTHTLTKTIKYYENMTNKTEAAMFEVKTFELLSEVVKKCAQQFSQSELDSWKNKVESYKVIKIEDGCGGMQNRLITFNDSSKACVRYRFNIDLMQGEMYSYYLSKLLNMGYTVPTTLHVIENNDQWSEVQTEIAEAKWSESRPLIFTKWVENLKPVFMPSELKTLDKTLNLNTGFILGKSVSELCDLVHWSDLIVFDYILANPDRVVNNMFNFKWNDKMMDKAIHNLQRSDDKGTFVFLDNESGLLHGYRLLDSHRQFHNQLLNSICIFSPQTVKTVSKLHEEGNIGDKLIGAFVAEEKYQNMLPRISAKNLKILQSRVEDVYKHMQSCKLKISNDFQHS